MYQKTDARLSKKIKELTAETKSLVDERDNLKKKLKGFEDYDEIKRELQIMKVNTLHIYIYRNESQLFLSMLNSLQVTMTTMISMPMTFSKKIVH